MCQSSLMRQNEYVGGKIAHRSIASSFSETPDSWHPDHRTSPPSTHRHHHQHHAHFYTRSTLVLICLDSRPTDGQSSRLEMTSAMNVVWSDVGDIFPFPVRVMHVLSSRRQLVQERPHNSTLYPTLRRRHSKQVSRARRYGRFTRRLPGSSGLILVSWSQHPCADQEKPNNFDGMMFLASLCQIPGCETEILG